MKEISIKHDTRKPYTATRHHGVAGKTAFNKLLVEKIGLGEEGSFYGPLHHLKQLHYWTLNNLHSAANFRGGCASNHPR
jgi:hypothetical protein